LAVFPGVSLNGKLTLGENIADRGGLSIAWEAWQRTLSGKAPAPLEGWTGEQRFFLSFAKIWESNWRESFQLDRLKWDVHSPDTWRINGTLPHIEEWYRAFGVTPANKLYIPPEKRIPSIW
jgi:putative endopeptidase